MAPVAPIDVVPYLYIFFAPVELTFNVGFDALLYDEKYTCIVTPWDNVLRFYTVATLAAVPLAVLHVP